MSQISAAVLAAATEQLAFVAALRQRANEARAVRLRVIAVLLEHQRELLTNELRTRDPALARGLREEPIVFRVERDSGRLLFGKCH